MEVDSWGELWAPDGDAVRYSEQEQRKTSELKPCPFCGKQPTVYDGDTGTDYYDFTYNIYCNENGCPEVRVSEKSKQKSVEVWNKRA